jgi:hypothetical protein
MPDFDYFLVTTEDDPFPCSEILEQRKTKGSGWQELNLREHVLKTCGWPLSYTRTVGEDFLALSV